MFVRVSSWYEEVGKCKERVASCRVIFTASVMKIRQFKSYCEWRLIDKRTTHPSSAELKERVVLYIYPHPLVGPPWPVLR
jgi:hypothetical protein